MSFATQSSSRPVAQPAPTQTIWFASNWRVLVAVIALIASPSLPPTGLSSTYKIKLSPRGDWRAPSDAFADTWLAELTNNVPEA